MKKISVFLSAVIISLALVACNGAGIKDSGLFSTGSPDIGENYGENRFLLDESFLIAYPDEDEGSKEAAIKLQNAIKSVYGFNPGIKKGKLSYGEKGIILNDFSNNPKENMLSRDYEIKIGGYKIILSGGSPAALSECADEFVSEFIEGEENHLFVKSDGYYFQDNYELDSISVNGTDIFDYDIVYDENIAATGLIAQGLIDKIAGRTGRYLQKRDVKSPPGEMYEIRIGVGDKDNNPVFSDYDYAFYSDSEGNIVLNATGKSLAETEAKNKLNEFFSAEADNENARTLSLDLTHEFKPVEGAEYSLDFVSARCEEELFGGVRQYRFDYINAENKPVVVFAVEMKASSGCTITAGTKNDGYEIGGVENTGTVLDMAESARNNGKEVVCAVNSGFFVNYGTSPSFLPEGVLVKDGRVLSAGSPGFSRQWWGLTDTSEIIFGEYNDLFTDRERTVIRDDLVQAAAGNHLLYKNGERVFIWDNDKNLTENRHPRSCFLTRENGDMMIFVADGRSALSAGVTMEEEQEIAMRMGAYNALNLDGGGSSQLVKGGSGGLRIVNNPCPEKNGKNRAVADSIIFIKR